MGQERRNENSGFRYWLQVAMCLLLSMSLFKRYLFRSVLGLNEVQSKIILWLLIIVSFFISRFFSDTRHGKGWTETVTLLFPFTLYAAFAYSATFHYTALVLSCLAVAALCVYLVWTWARPVPKDKEKSRVIRSRFRQTARYMRSIPTLFLCPILIAAIVVMLRGGTIIVSDVGADQEPLQKAAVSVQSEGTDWVCKLDDEAWKELSAQEKLDLLQLVANYECAVLGIPQDISVQSGITKKKTVLGEYNSDKNTITINIDHLKKNPPMETVKTIAHECFHAYQKCLMRLLEDTDEQYKDLWLFDEARQYREEFANYHDGGDTHEEFEEYYYQTVEEDAREYAENAVERYKTLISLRS